MATTAWQPGWFEVSAAIGVVVTIVAGCWLVARYVARHCDQRVREGVNQQTREARELHDALLQNFQGVLLKFHAAASLLPQRASEARSLLDGALVQADQTIAESRDAMQRMGSASGSSNGLAEDLMGLASELGADPADEDAPRFHIDVQGAPLEFRGEARDGIYHIAREAVRNALRHARADNIHVDIQYGARHFRVCVRDDGRGIALREFETTGDDRVIGLTGMRERAGLFGATVSVRMPASGGTEVQLVVPASSAYVAPLPSRRI